MSMYPGTEDLVTSSSVNDSLMMFANTTSRSALSDGPQVSLVNSTANSTRDYMDDEQEYIFDRTDVRVIFITLYTLVFCCCFFGNLLVILVVTLSRRLRSITNFFLANLAVADLCVGVFCVFQNLSMYLIPTWVLGDFLCKMYQFVHSLSYTASIFILVVICTERYFAIIHPITCKQILTPTRLRFVILAVWIMSAMYSSPRFMWVQTIENKMKDGHVETICTTHRQKYNSELFDIINFVLLYCIPLAIMTILYTRIAVGLWRSSRRLEKHLNASASTQTMNQLTGSSVSPNSCSGTHLCHQQMRGYKQQPLHLKASSEGNVTVTGKPLILNAPNPTSSQNVLKARRGVIRMLIIVVLTFAICNLPYHARKMWQYWSTGYRGPSNFSTLFTPLTFLITYFNSGVNPLLYAFLSRNFRRGMREILLCSILARGGRNGGDRHGAAATLRMQRGASTRSTLKNATTVTVLHSGDYSADV